MIQKTIDGVHPALWLAREFMAAERRLHNGLGYPEVRTDPEEGWASATLDWRLRCLARANNALGTLPERLPTDELDDLRARLRRAQDERPDELMEAADEIRAYLARLAPGEEVPS